MLKHFVRLTFLLALTSWVRPASAQDSAISQKYDSISLNLSEVVVSADRYGTLRLKTPEAIRVLDEKSIRKFQLRTAPEALSVTPGVFIQKTNHGGGSPFVRGLTGNQTLLLTDGIRLSNSIVRYGPNQYFNTIDVFSIGKMEVMRGSGSVQYGSDAIGGTIQTFTPDLSFMDKPSWKGTLLSRFATQGMEKSGHADATYSAKNAAFRGGITYRNFGDIVGGDTTGRQSPTGYNEFDYDLKGKIRISESTDLTMVYQNVHQDDVPVYHKIMLENYAVNRMNPQKRQLGYLRLDRKLNAGMLKSARLTASFQKNGETREMRKNNSTILRTENDRIRSLGISAEAYAANNKGWTSNTGIDIYNDLVMSTRTDADLSGGTEVKKRGLYPDDSKMTSLALFSMQNLEVNNWIISAGARFNSYIISVKDEATGTTVLKPSALVGSLAVLRKFNDASSVFISANTGFRAPNIDDLGTLGIVDFRYETPNFELKPEHSFQYQAGYKFHGNKLNGECYLYRNELYNLIVRNKVPGDTIEGYPVYRKENVERSYIGGAETAWEFAASPSVSFSGSLTWTFGQNITRNEPVRRIPPLFGRLSAEYAGKNWQVNLEWLAAGKQDRLAAGDRDDNRIPSGGTPGWNVFNINSGFSLGKAEIDLNILNILNEDYRYHGSGINGYGRSAFLTLILHI